ncbi:MAG: DUF3795 domain-containing protein [Chitinispirillaceae bacterium]
MNSNISAYCGLDCSKCPVLIADSKNDLNAKRKIAEEWSVQYKEYIGKELFSNDIMCNGCRSDAQRKFIGCLNCSIRKCAAQKQIQYCSQCPDFRNCDMIQGFLSQNENAF